MTYEPEVNDYVVWHRENWDNVDKGWVYFKCDEYITIEISVKEKPNCQYAKNDRHKYIHCLLLCYAADWKNLEYITKRQDFHDDVPVPELSTIPPKGPEMGYIRRVKGNTHEQRSVIPVQSKSS